MRNLFVLIILLLNLTSYAQEGEFELSFQSSSKNGERLLATFDAQNLDKYEGLQIVGEIVDGNGNWGFALPTSSKFSIYVRFSGEFKYGIQQDTKLSNITLKLRKVSPTKVNLMAYIQHQHRYFYIKMKNLSHAGNKPIITLGNPDILSTEGDLIIEEPVYGIQSDINFSGMFTEPIELQYNEGQKQLIFQRKDGALSYENYLNEGNDVIYKNKSGGGNFEFQSNIGGKGNKSVMYLHGQYGNVGIGTSTPDSKLTVAGKIHAQEVKVTVDAGSVPDYVFAKGYNLMSLKDIENYIENHHHLPDVQSAEELSEEGLHLAEMNLLLLRKIEELTLYTIEQEKELDSLRIINTKLDKVEKQLQKYDDLINQLLNKS